MSGGVYNTSSSSDRAALQQSIVRSVVQLSPLQHTHPKGRQLVSLLRRSEVVATLVSLLYCLVLEFEHDNAQPAVNTAATKATASGHKKARRTAESKHHAVKNVALSAGQLKVFAVLVEALHSIATADISLVQQLNKEQQVPITICLLSQFL